MKLQPITAFWNKQYYSSDYGKKLLAIMKEFTEKLQTLNSEINSKEGQIFHADDCITVFRNLGFLEDPIFLRAVGPRANDKILMGRLWRLWITSWSLHSCWELDGDVLDLGTYNGKAFFTALKYSILKSKNNQKKSGKVILADLFEDPPKEAKKSEHGPELYGQVSDMFQTLCPEAIVVKGFLPNSIKNFYLQKVSWCQIDLNKAEADLECLKFIYPLLNKGAHIILDDYGASRYSKTQKMVDDFMIDKPERILELPTMQGLLIKK